MVTTRSYIARLVAHWTLAASRLRDVDTLAPRLTWEALEQYLGIALRRTLEEAARRLDEQGMALRLALGAARSRAELEAVRRRLLAFRARYLQTEATLDFYADAVNTRSSPEIGTLLRACDAMAYRGMALVLDQLGKPTPLVLTYLDKGLGASILKADLPLWDRTTKSPVAAIKIVRHNLYRPTAVTHEIGHQVAELVGWNEELRAAIHAALAPRDPELADTWSLWSSEIAADAFAFVHTGYASVAGLHDVVAGDDRSVFRCIAGDPHPIGFLRVLLGVEMCRQCYGTGPWDALAAVWKDCYPLQSAPSRVARLIAGSLDLLPLVVEVCIGTSMRCFGGRPLVALVNPERVRPEALMRMEAQLGPALYTSSHWIWTESLRLLALTGYRAATLPDGGGDVTGLQEQWMLRLGGSVRAA